MDALSQVLEDIHLKKTEYLYLQNQGAWAFHLPSQSAVLCHIALFGDMYIYFNNHEFIHLNSGDMLIIPSGMAHSVQSQMDSSLIESINIAPLFQGLRDDAIHLGQAHQRPKTLIFSIRSHMDSVMASPLIKALPTYLHIKNALTAQEPEWLRIGLYFVAGETQLKQPGRHKIMDHLVSIMLIECIRDYIANLADPQNWLSALTHPELSPAFAAIHSQPEHTWSVESLAKCCFMSRSKFALLFNKVVNTTPLAYLQQHRLRLASQYLRLEQHSIQQIAHRVGYSSETAFSQAFKKHYECTPSQYRQNHIQPAVNNEL